MTLLLTTHEPSSILGHNNLQADPARVDSAAHVALQCRTAKVLAAVVCAIVSEHYIAITYGGCENARALLCSDWVFVRPPYYS